MGGVFSKPKSPKVAAPPPPPPAPSISRAPAIQEQQDSGRAAETLKARRRPRGRRRGSILGLGGDSVSSPTILGS